MLELRFIRENLDLVKVKTAARGLDIGMLDTFAAIDARRLAILAEVEALKQRRNTVSKEISVFKQAGDEASAAPLVAEMKTANSRIKELDEELSRVDEELSEIVMAVPNLLDDSVPEGNDDADNIEIKTWGEKPAFDFAPKSHWDLGTELGIIDFERAAKLSGARFSLLSDFAAQLERALTAFMLELHTTRHGYREFIPPYLVNTASMTATGQLPKFAEDLFKIDDWDLYLIPTAEVPLTNIHRDETIDERDLPLKYTAFTPCFRSEAGSYGRDTRGLIRQHQFNKVELVKFTTPETSAAELESLLADAETVLRMLGLHYRVVTLCSGDLGFSATKTYDIEVWLPGQQAYREISSCSNFLDFQARRGGIRYRPEGEKKSRLVHTLNGSGLAVGRTLIAIMENYQRQDGTITLPDVLKPYCEPRLPAL
ncbi:MAG: serine--tRNA ligase [Desulfofustis sp. PB-SRB1]|jgi:seryl-tRNA synthetase|nr:serine--tRNA ligase [Desulfofustis sp. PB-SRB1]MBM1002168.1 serine--tRNA ligase [Desulfofustis sp. PB-SRB1]HBH31305.1 serine--tRNA ligase [Desulfofustis sp.]